MSSSSRKAKNMNNNPIYKNPNSPIPLNLSIHRALSEKIGQITQIDQRVATRSAIRDLSIGSILSAGSGGPFEKATSSDWIDMIDTFQNAALESRLGIPLLYGTNAVHGNNVYGATVFPHNIGLGATRDAELVRRIGVATALEVKACGAQFTFAPCVARKEEDMLAQKKILDGQMEEMPQILDENTPSEQDQGGRSITSSGLDVEKKFQYQLSFVSHSPQVSDILGLFDRQFGRSDVQEPDPEERVTQWKKASVQEMKDKFSAIGLGPRQFAVMSAFLGPDQMATETLLATDRDVAPWVEKYQ